MPVPRSKLQLKLQLQSQLDLFLSFSLVYPWQKQVFTTIAGEPDE